MAEAPYNYLTADEMKSLGDDSMPIDVTLDEKHEKQLAGKQNNFDLSQQLDVTQKVAQASDLPLIEHAGTTMSQAFGIFPLKNPESFFVYVNMSHFCSAT
jgi:hypothetical protein